jgi:uncharacterized membrane protein YoaK (UPF0700 family)/anti-anti-sigma regulatory factor
MRTKGAANERRRPRFLAASDSKEPMLGHTGAYFKVRHMSGSPQKNRAAQRFIRTRVRAHSFLLQARLAISLAWVAGFVNVVAVIVCGTVVSHVTGHASQVGRNIGEATWQAALVPAALIAAFFVGALASGFAIEFGRQRGWASVYVLPASMELVLLATFGLLESFGVVPFSTSQEISPVISSAMSPAMWWMILIVSVALGLQNATITRISSGVVRTTHLTGVITDLGHESAQLLMIRQKLHAPTHDAGSDGPSFQRLFLLASIAGSFVFGSACGALSERTLGHLGMLPPILLLVWIVIADLRTPICAIEPAMLAADDCGRSDIMLFRAIPRGGDGIEAHLPNLAAWIAALPENTRAVVLDLRLVRVLGPLGASALEALFTAADRRGVQICVAGIDDIDAATVNALTRANLLHEGNFAKEVESAMRLVHRTNPDADNFVK